MELIQENFKLNTVEHILSCIDGITKDSPHYSAIIYRKNYLGPTVKADIWMADDESELDEIKNRYFETIMEYYPSSALFKDGVMLYENNGHTLFSRDCKKCKHKIPSVMKDGKAIEYKCDVFDCEPNLVTYICYNREEK